MFVHSSYVKEQSARFQTCWQSAQHYAGFESGSCQCAIDSHALGPPKSMEMKFEEDVENYRYWTTMKVRPKLKTRLPQSLVPSEDTNFNCSSRNY
ncbi:uncharacterized protein LOC118274597 [Spodoptera frugiperda]|uniref:Uncharacterized protein LOC118274597 n=1 Tax=Spodoptera frugiperda TaxID=7108 RepID=A0A9R0F4I6_SPOFR|nr:uncharacterized protein LOC118274597 [Spodoptera frugiperda]